jgi:hypothetical protein
LPPYEEITKEAYEKLVSKVDISIPLVQTSFGMVDFGDCEGGACPVR